MGLPRSKQRRCLHLGACLGERQKEREEKPKKQREATWNILVTKSEDSVVPWNIKGTTGGEVMTNSERVIPLTFVSFKLVHRRGCSIASYCSKSEVGLLNSWHSGNRK